METGTELLFQNMLPVGCMNEKESQLSMIPWDYNLGFGTFSAGNATNTVNTPIDSPVSGGSSDRPMLNWIFKSEEYTDLYHQYFSELLNSVDIQSIIDNAYNLVKAYVDASAVTLSDMGSMNGGMGGFGGDTSGRPENKDGFDGRFPGQFFDDQTETAPSDDPGAIEDSAAGWLAVSAAVLAIGLVAAKRYKG